MHKIGIVGGTGYTGVELLRLLAKHPDVEVSAITSRGNAGTPVTDMFPSLRGHVDLVFSEPDAETLAACDLVFFATPHGTAMEMAPQLLQAGTRIVDLGPDFRLRDASVWQQWYKLEHSCPDLLDEAVYGLPEINRDRIRQARLVANPGCYPTCVILGYLPLLERGLIEPARLYASAASGVSGAGRQPQVRMLMGEAGEGFTAYGASGHRHLPEIRQGLRDIAGHADIGLVFVPHLLPMIRGMHATLYGELNREVDLQALYDERYADEPFVDVLPAGSHPETRTVRGTNTCRLAVHRGPDTSTAVVLSAIDNLTKGAAGQAIQNMNLMLGLSETGGLDQIALVP